MEEVLTTAKLRKGAKANAEKVIEKLNRQSVNIQTHISDLERKYAQNSDSWTNLQLDELKQEMDDHREKLEGVKQLINKENPKAIQNMVRQQYKKDVVQRRIGMRKASTGRPKALDEEDEKFILECIENKATAHVCRHDPVLYMNHRVKKRDFLKLANYSRHSRGLKSIKSATTVYNRARPRNRRSIQVQKHLGLGLFCSKKPPKLQENDNLLTHYQRAFKKGILMKQCHESNGDGLLYNLFISRDDKAYICPGTSTGVQSARNIRVIQPTDVSRQHVLPRYDFPNRLVNATPSVNRIMKLDLQEVEGSQKIKIAKDDTVVFNRPKYFVGSSGSVWASEYMRLRVVEPKLFMLEIENQLPANVVSLLLAILDQLKYYILGTNPADVSNISNDSSCVHRKYEVCRATIVHKTLTTSMFGLDNEVLTDRVKDVKSTITAVINSCNQLTEQLKEEGEKIEITRTIRSPNEKCTDCLQKIQTVIPKLKSRIHEFTDAGRTWCWCKQP
ncbi:RNA-directed DNA polymerase from transposon X-element [Paramuricea clavata]|uniref:RNA-directed DNA polymerase from transposon X-element n=1 Tax=Paramuricea clavata TaxID=317549 RepID=A0A6S7I764_PARCT|nr:RNA-directed DNA polymerase from transposon X-element [Paramuricea clavata]